MKNISFILNGKKVIAKEGETIWQVAKKHGENIPHLCYEPKPGYRPDGNCRACMVEVDGERTLVASCIRKPTKGMKVAEKLRLKKYLLWRMVLNLLLFASFH